MPATVTRTGSRPQGASHGHSRGQCARVPPHHTGHSIVLGAQRAHARQRIPSSCPHSCARKAASMCTEPEVRERPPAGREARDRSERRSRRAARHSSAPRCALVDARVNETTRRRPRNERPSPRVAIAAVMRSVRGRPGIESRSTLGLAPQPTDVPQPPADVGSGPSSNLELRPNPPQSKPPPPAVGAPTTRRGAPSARVLHQGWKVMWPT